MTQDTPRWIAQPERGSLPLMKGVAWFVGHAPRFMTHVVIWLITLYFWLTSPKARRSIAQYQTRLSQWSGRPGLFPSFAPTFHQFLAFGMSLVARLDVWEGRMRHADVGVADPDNLYSQLQSGRGQILLGAHLGNPDICRALSEQVPGMMLNILVHDGNAMRYHAVMQRFGDPRMRIIQVSELNIDVMMQLKLRVDQGEWLAIAGDRIALHGQRTVEIDFLGHRAEFAQGPWLLAGLLQCPINTFFGVPQDGRYQVTLRRLAEPMRWTQATRDEVIAQHVQMYGDKLAEQCLQTPLQWFNFFPFWKDNA